MKLTRVTPYVVKTPPPNLGGFVWLFLKLETDAGICGWGETAVLFTLYGLEPGFERMVETIFRTYLKGKNPLDREPLNKLLYAALTAQHPDFVTVGLISAFDIAMWDICGKYYNTPVYNLLGGKCRDRIRTYTYLYDLESGGNLLDAIEDWTTSHSKLAASAAKCVEEGFTAVKLDPIRQALPGTYPVAPWEIGMAEYEFAERAIGAIREAVGSKADILIGTHGQITPAASRRLARRLEKFDPLWLEEPCPPENFAEMARIARSTSIPIATGERLVTIHDFQKLFAAGACAVAQPDLGSCGGITACKQIAALAEAHYVLLAPHVWGGPVITAAALQIDAVIANFLIQESIYKSRGFFDEIVREPFTWENGELLVPDRPGIGIELDEAKLEQHRGSIAELLALLG
jgi:galactonate dehydratase